MSELLFVNACVRGARSRTLALARHFLTEYEKSHPGDRVTVGGQAALIIL